MHRCNILLINILDEQTYEREIMPFKMVKDHYPKYIVTMDEVPMREDLCTKVLKNTLILS